MKSYYKYNSFVLLLVGLILYSPVYAEEESEEVIDISHFNSKQRDEMGIQTALVSSKNLTQRLIAPGEVRVNAYQSSQVTTRISAQILKRHAKMGDKVTIGDKLVTLTSVAMAEAQGELFITDREWQRVKKLGRKVVSEQRYIKAQVARQQAYAKVLAYGMTESQAKQLIVKNNASKATGKFDLLSVQEGVIISDNFVTGQVVEAGQILMEISDESIIWVETKIPPEDSSAIKIDTKADVYVSNDQVLTGKVIQIHHKIDEKTRTLPVRIAVNNTPYLLHPGQFVKTALYLSMGKKVVAIPKSSVMLLQGNQVVFQLLKDKLQATLVATGEVRNDWIEIKNGLNPGDEIVIKKMFLLKSLLLKSQIGDAD